MRDTVTYVFIYISGYFIWANNFGFKFGIFFI